MCVPQIQRHPCTKSAIWLLGRDIPSITLNKSLQEGAITCSMRLDVMSDRALFDMCPYSDRVNSSSLDPKESALFDLPGRSARVAATKHGNRISTYMILISPLQLGPLAYQEFSNPYIFIVRDGCFLLSNLESEGVHKSLGESWGAPSPTLVKVNMSPEKGPC